jgi:hypothetical protein
MESAPIDRARFVVLGRYLNLADADLTRSMLVAAGLEARVRDEYFAGLNWYNIPALGGVRLEVPAEQWEEAKDLLSAEPEPVDRTAEEQAELDVARGQRRTLGTVALALQFLPLLAPVVMGLLLARTFFRKEESPEHDDG